MWEPIKNPDFVADPAKGSRHNRGAAVDLTLIDLKSGVDLEARPGHADAGGDVVCGLSLRVEDGRGHGAGRAGGAAELHAVRGVAPEAGAHGQRELDGEEVLRAEVQLGHVAGPVGLV